MELRRFDPDRYYRPTDPEMAIFGAVSTLAQWRHAGQGPSFVRFGNRILYRGDSLNSFLDAHTVAYATEGVESGTGVDEPVDARNASPGASQGDKNPLQSSGAAAIAP